MSIYIKWQSWRADDFISRAPPLLERAGSGLQIDPEKDF